MSSGQGEIPAVQAETCVCVFLAFGNPSKGHMPHEYKKLVRIVYRLGYQCSRPCIR